MAGEDNGEESTLEGGEESGLLSPEEVDAAIAERCRRGRAGRRCVGGGRERYCWGRIVRAVDGERETRGRAFVAAWYAKSMVRGWE